MIIECHQPLVLEIAGYLTESTHDFVAFYLASRTISGQVQLALQHIWRDLYARKWPAFADCLRFTGGAQDWRSLYQKTLKGRYECTLEVFDREKKIGFAMAAMPARVQYDYTVGAYIARYLSASEVRPETIPYADGHRLRFCPASARAQLQPGIAPKSGAGDMRVAYSEGGGKDLVPALPPYPCRVLEGTEGLRVGQGVELQWKMQMGSPFGWWYGKLEELRKDPGSRLAHATITFGHFPVTSQWYRLEVRFGDSELRPCSFGGYTGGIRATSEAEHRQWMRFFPREPVVF